MHDMKDKDMGWRSESEIAPDQLLNKDERRMSAYHTMLPSLFYCIIAVLI
jgi:hypothetical protein